MGDPHLTHEKDYPFWIKDYDIEYSSWVAGIGLLVITMAAGNWMESQACHFSLWMSENNRGRLFLIELEKKHQHSLSLFPSVSIH